MLEQHIKRPKVGLGVYIFDDSGHVLLGKRLSKLGISTWAPPGGHLEFGETWEKCSKREVLEECGITIKNITFWGVTNDIFDGNHYVSLQLRAQIDSGYPKVKEPLKIACWSWFSLDNLPNPLFHSVSTHFKQLKLL